MSAMQPLQGSNTSLLATNEVDHHRPATVGTNLNPDGRSRDPFPVLHLWQRLIPRLALTVASATCLAALATLIDRHAINTVVNQVNTVNKVNAGVTTGALTSAAASAAAAGSLASATTVGGATRAPPGVQCALLAAHLASLPLLASGMFVFQQRHDALVAAGARDQRLLPQLALAAMMTGIAAEVGWHSAQGWVYHDTADALNWLFYQGLATSLALLAYSARAPTSLADHATDAFLLSSASSIPMLYLGAQTCLRTKLPIHLVLTAVFAVLTRRMMALLADVRVWLFPLFGVGVNLGFIVLLRAHESSPLLNPLFHICHDLFGTELGMAVLLSLVWVLPPATAGHKASSPGAAAGAGQQS
eukprot:jgi/Mesvir1/23734/Mv18675-RA.1